jgi:GH25 family lysozyme M1 (1,4-beta-N-acetylmuramidase)
MARSKVFAKLVAGEKPVVDLSEHNGNKRTNTRIDWNLLAPEIEAAYIRVSDGTSYPDTEFDYNYSEAVRLKVPVGVWQFCRAKQNLDAQILLFEGSVRAHNHEPEEGWWADWEAPYLLSGKQLVDRMRAYMVELEGAIGRKPGIYTGSWCWCPKYLKPYPDWSGTYRLWAAHWTRNPAVRRPQLPLGWIGHELWQYGKCKPGELPGILTEVDLNRRNPVPAPGTYQLVERMAHRAALLGWDLRTLEG